MKSPGSLFNAVELRAGWPDGARHSQRRIAKSSAGICRRPRAAVDAAECRATRKRCSISRRSAARSGRRMCAPDGRQLLTIGGNDAAAVEPRHAPARRCATARTARSRRPPSRRTASCSSPAVGTTRPRFGTPRPATRFASSTAATPATSTRSSSRPTAANCSPPATTARPGCGTSQSGKPTGVVVQRPHGPRARRDVLARRHARAHRQRRQDGAHLGPANRPAPADARRPRVGRALRPVLARWPARHHRQPGQDGHDLGRRHRRTSSSTLAGHTAAVTSVAFSPDGSRVLTGSQDNTVKLWDAATNAARKSSRSPATRRKSRRSRFSPDGRCVLSSSRDGTAIIWLAVDWHNDVALRTAMSH